MFQREQDTNGQTWFDRKYFQGIRLKKKKNPQFPEKKVWDSEGGALAVTYTKPSLPSRHRVAMGGSS